MMKNNKIWGGYAAPALEVLDVNVENGFAASPIYGDEGDAGQAIDDDYFGEF